MELQIKKEAIDLLFNSSGFASASLNADALMARHETFPPQHWEQRLHGEP